MLKLDINPNQKHITNIENWLSSEWNNTNEGFYCNWEIILVAFKKNNLIVITRDDYPIGFLSYRIHNSILIIDKLEIKPLERRKGYAKELLKQTFEHFITERVLVTKLYCSPPSSESFWEKIGFNNLPKLQEHADIIYMYKPLVKTLQPEGKANINSTISLWNCEPYQINDTLPTWVWNLIFLEDKKTLIRPIIFPASANWQLELVLNGKKIITNQVKKLSKHLLFDENFIILTKIIT
ncbi:GNAT family N-acetyltransferase [Hyunsoonleella sp. 2307UL5-6]|uniref:GNAT family N-acetyltransferase n=1 Tax=Hyunsoonleella sp. 2307UL5-6 TaxID=3384768 RepID=UPI0039BD7E15